MDLWFIPGLLGFYPYRTLRRVWRMAPFRRLQHISANLRGDDIRDMFAPTWRSRDIAACFYSETLAHPMDITPRRYHTDSISSRGVITPRHKYPRYVRSVLTGRSRDILYTVTWNVKTETSSYLRDVFIPRRPFLRWAELGGTNVRDITPRCHWIHVSLGLILSLTVTTAFEPKLVRTARLIPRPLVRSGNISDTIGQLIGPNDI